MHKVRRSLFGAILLLLGGTLFVLAPKATAQDLGPPSTSCADRVCVENPTPICLSDRPTCPFDPPLCWYNGQEPLGLKHLSCHEDEPPPTGTPTYMGACFLNETLCVGAERQRQGPGGGTCPWIDWVAGITHEEVEELVSCKP